MNYIEIAKNKFENITITENYSDTFEELFNKHLKDLFNLANTLIENFHTEIITESIYWQTEAMILELLDDVEDDAILDELDILENMLYDNIKKALGESYNEIFNIKKNIDFTVHSILLSVKFNYFSRKDEFVNPWKYAEDILFNNSLLDIQKITYI